MFGSIFEDHEIFNELRENSKGNHISLPKYLAKRSLKKFQEYKLNSKQNSLKNVTDLDDEPDNFSYQLDTKQTRYYKCLKKIHKNYCYRLRNDQFIRRSNLKKEISQDLRELELDVDYERLFDETYDDYRENKIFHVNKYTPKHEVNASLFCTISGIPLDFDPYELCEQLNKLGFRLNVENLSRVAKKAKLIKKRVGNLICFKQECFKYEFDFFLSLMGSQEIELEGSCCKISIKGPEYCSACQLLGHLSSNCLTKSKSCFYCKNTGHFIENCSKKQIADLRKVHFRKNLVKFDVVDKKPVQLDRAITLDKMYLYRCFFF